MDSGLYFNEDLHKYFVGEAEIPSVTYILRYLNTDMAHIDPSILANASDRGTRIHSETVDFDMRGEDAEIDDDILPYVQAYADFKRDYGINRWDMFERPMWTNNRQIDCGQHISPFAGTLDRLGFIEGFPTVVDIKTGSSLHLDSHITQLSAYWHLCEYNDIYNDECIQCAILHLKKDGKYKYIKFLKSDVISAYYDLFLPCLNMERTRKSLLESIKQKG